MVRLGMIRTRRDEVVKFKETDLIYNDIWHRLGINRERVRQIAGRKLDLLIKL